MQVFSLLLPKNRLNGLLLGLSLFLAVPALAQTENTPTKSADSTKTTRDWKSVEDFIYPQRLSKFDIAVGLAYGGGRLPQSSVFTVSNNTYLSDGDFSRFVGIAQLHGEFSILGSTAFRNPKHKFRVGDIFDIKLGGNQAFNSNMPDFYKQNSDYRQVYWYDHLKFGFGFGFAIAYKTLKTDYLIKVKLHNDFNHLTSLGNGDGKTIIEGLITQKVWQYGFGFSLPVITNYSSTYRLDLGTTYLEAAKRLNTGQLIGLRLAYQHFSIQNRSGFTSNETYPVTNSVQATIFWRLQR